MTISRERDLLVDRPSGFGRRFISRSLFGFISIFQSQQFDFHCRHLYQAAIFRRLRLLLGLIETALLCDAAEYSFACVAGAIFFLPDLQIKSKTQKVGKDLDKDQRPVRSFRCLVEAFHDR